MTSLHTTKRPKTFAEVIGQDDIVKSLKRVVKEGRAHAFIFTGPSGTGKTTLARILADNLSGGGNSPANVVEIDAATNSGADAMRAVIAQSFYRGMGSSPVKAMIVDECHRLSTAAWTILLKPVEEPPKHVYWMFASTEPAKIPRTIQTRCLRFDLKLLSEEQILELLVRVADEENFSTPDAVLEAIAENSGGSPRQSLVFLEQCVHCTSPSQALNFMRATGQSKEVVDLARLLVAKRGTTWGSILKLLNQLGDVDPESVRIILSNYIAGALLKARSEDEAKNFLRVLDCFSTPYQQSDKMSPLLLSIGFALGLDQ